MTDVIQVSVRRELPSDRLRDQLPRRSRRVVSVLLTTAVAVDVCRVMLKFAGVPQTRQQISAASGLKSPYYEDMWRRYCCLVVFVIK